MGKRKVYEDIMLKPDEEKVQQYELIDFIHKLGNPVEVKEHGSGFPAVTIDCCNIHILTDCLSLETWWIVKYPDKGGEDGTRNI